jgi:hypothetical protein
MSRVSRVRGLEVSVGGFCGGALHSSVMSLFPEEEERCI